MNAPKGFVPIEDYQAILEEYGNVVEERNKLQDQLLHMRNLRMMQNREPE